MTTVTIVMPVGPGHEGLQEEAMASVLSAADHPGPFEDIRFKIVPDPKGELGRSRARNIGAEGATGDWLFFLDADDILLLNAFEAVGPYLEDWDAIWGLILELGPSQAMKYREGQIMKMNNETEPDCYLENDPFLTCQMGHFVRREAFIPFNEYRDVGEDIQYYLSMWTGYGGHKPRSCIKIPDVFFVNRRGAHSRGPRSGTGRDWNRAVALLMRDARRELANDNS